MLVNNAGIIHVNPLLEETLADWNRLLEVNVTVQDEARAVGEDAGMADFEMRLGWVIAYVDDPGAAAEFYQRTFGLNTEFVVPGEYAQLDTGSTKLGFAGYRLGESNFPGGVRRAAGEGQPPNVEIALVHEDVEEAFRRAVEAGCEPLAPPADKPQGQRVGFVRDPFGLLVELATPL